MKIAAIVLASLLAGCSLLPNNSLNYRDAEVIEPMVVPEGSVFIGESPLYDVPDVSLRKVGRAEGERRFEAPKPPQLVVLGNEDDEDSEPVPEGETPRAVLSRDGNGYPIIMLYTRYAWAWEYVNSALAETDLRVDDRNREIGVFYLRVPSRYELEQRNAQLKLSHTTNGIQVAVLNNAGTALVEKGPSQAMLERLHRALNAR